MKNTTKDRLEKSRPTIDAHKAIKYCLDQLYFDKTRSYDEHVLGDLTFEELIGALLMGRDAVEELSRGDDFNNFFPLETDQETADAEKKDDQYLANAAISGGANEKSA